MLQGCIQAVPGTPAGRDWTVEGGGAPRTKLESVLYGGERPLLAKHTRGVRIVLCMQGVQQHP